MSEFLFSVERMSPQACQAPGCTKTARNAVRMFFPDVAGPVIVCGHHKAWAKQQCREGQGDE